MNFGLAKDKELVAVLHDQFATEDDKQQVAAEIMKRTRGRPAKDYSIELEEIWNSWEWLFEEDIKKRNIEQLDHRVSKAMTEAVLLHIPRAAAIDFLGERLRRLIIAVVGELEAPVLVDLIKERVNTA